jgi:predicted phosphodiesterase
MRQCETEVEIPVDVDLSQVTPPPADRTYVDSESPGAPYAMQPLDLGSRTIERLLLLPDTHAPYHDPCAWAVMMKLAREYRPDTVVHLGDLADCLTVSAHDKDPRRGTQFEDEAKVVRERREELEGFGAQRNVICLGNHEYRLRRYLMQQAPALMSSVGIEAQLGLDNGRWRIVPYREHGRIGKLHLTHDANYHGANAVRQMAVAFNASVAFGHTHRMGLSYFGDVAGKRHVSVNLGCLCKIEEATFAPAIQRMTWQHGFGVASMLPNGRFWIQLLPIVDRRVVMGEKVHEL